MKAETVFPTLFRVAGLATCNEESDKESKDLVASRFTITFKIADSEYRKNSTLRRKKIAPQIEDRTSR